jgi:hypothetical protein
VSAVDISIILGAVGVLVTSITGAIINLRRTDQVKEVLQGDVREVHKIVNQQRTDMLAYQKQLEMALRAAGVHVPEDKSL